MRICLVLPLLFLLGTAVANSNMRKRQSEMCHPKISRNEYFDLAITGAIRTLTYQVEEFNGNKPVTTDRITAVNSMFMGYMVAGKNLQFVLKMLYLHCFLNKPDGTETKPKTAELAYLCLWESKPGQPDAEKCYTYVERGYGEIDLKEEGQEGDARAKVRIPFARAKPAVKPKAKAKTAVKPKAKAKTAVKPKAKARTGVKPKAKARTGVKPKAKARTAVKPKPKTKTRTAVKPKTIN